MTKGLKGLKNFKNGRNKKGVSPLIATVLLIAFAVALGAVVMNWGRGFVQQQTSEAEKTTQTKLGCSLKVNIKVAEIDGVPQVCYGGGGSTGYLELRLNNEDETNDIKGLSISIGGETGIYNNDTINTTIPVGLSGYLNMSYSFASYGKVRNLRVIPKISIGGVVTPCGGSPLEKSTS
ncbi:MAG: archaellin/type IV pilin N-terminal domain-containing protein, partial [Nanoarchaeota archaeon]